MKRADPSGIEKADLWAVEAKSLRAEWLAALLTPPVLLAGSGLIVWPGPWWLQWPVGFLYGMAFCIISFLMLIAFPTGCVLIVRAAFGWRRGLVGVRLARATAWLTLSVLLFSVFVASFRLHHYGFVAASYRGDRIVAALAAYRAEHGAYPDELERLVPEYLPAIPGTGLMGVPAFVYRAGYNDLTPVHDAYELRINSPVGVMGFDRFIYWPSEAYPDRIQGNGVERIRGWAYVHE